MCGSLAHNQTSTHTDTQSRTNLAIYQYLHIIGNVGMKFIKHADDDDRIVRLMILSLPYNYIIINRKEKARRDDSCVCE